VDTSPLQSYISQLKKQGILDAEIKNQLVKAGWDSKIVDAALSGVLPPPPPPPSPTTGNTAPLAPKSATGMWDAFEHVLMFISLCSMATAAAFLVHTYIDKWFPGLTTYGGRSTSSGYDGFHTIIINSSIATLLVTYPLFAFLHLNVKHRTKNNPSIKSLRSRKFLIYLTLVVTFLIAIGNIIGAIYALLNGNITSNFLLHLSATLIIAGIIFAYYLIQVVGDRKLAAEQ